MQITFRSYNLPPGEYAVWMWRDNGSARLLGECFRTTYGKWQLAIDNGHGRQIREDFAKLADARARARQVWGVTA